MSSYIIALLAIIIESVSSNDLDVHNLSASTDFLLLKPGEVGDVKLEFQTTAPDISCHFDCNDTENHTESRPNFKDSNNGQLFCTAEFMANENHTKLCTGFVKTIINEFETDEFPVKFRVGMSLKVNDRPAFAWKGQKASFTTIIDYEHYPNNLSCMFMRKERLSDQKDCNITIRKAAEVDSGRYNVKICVTEYPSSCRVFETRHLNILKKEAPKKALELRISMFGNTKPSELYIVCVIGFSKTLPILEEIADGEVHFIWQNVTSTAPVLQIYLNDKKTLLFSTTVKDYEEHPDTHTDGLTIGLIIGVIGIVIGIVAGIVIYLYKTKKFYLKVAGKQSLDKSTNPCLDESTNPCSDESTKISLDTRTKDNEIELKPLNKKNGGP